MNRFQFVSPAKYFAAWRRMSRSWASLACSARNAAFSASNRAILAPGDSGRPCVGAAVAAPAVVPEPNLSTHSFNAPRDTPRSAAIPLSVAPGVDSYKSTARRRNSSV